MTETLNNHHRSSHSFGLCKFIHLVTLIPSKCCSLSLSPCLSLSLSTLHFSSRTLTLSFTRSLAHKTFSLTHTHPHFYGTSSSLSHTHNFSSEALGRDAISLFLSLKLPISVTYGYITIQSLAIYNNANLPSSIKMPKLVQKFAKYKINHPNFAQRLLKFCRNLATL